MAREGLMDDCGYDVYVDEDAWNDGFKAGFLKAVDEFAEKLKAKSTFLKSLQNDYYGYVCEEEIDEIADQLKEE